MSGPRCPWRGPTIEFFNCNIDTHNIVVSSKNRDVCLLKSWQTIDSECVKVPEGVFNKAQHKQVSSLNVVHFNVYRCQDWRALSNKIPNTSTGSGADGAEEVRGVTWRINELPGGRGESRLIAAAETRRWRGATGRAFSYQLKPFATQYSLSNSTCNRSTFNGL